MDTSIPLSLNYTPEDHTGENLVDALSLTLQEWNLDQCKEVAQLPR